MARLNDSQDVDSEILSPQPFHQSKGFLVSSLESPYQTENGQTSTDDYDSNSSPSTRHSTSDVFGHEMDDELDQLKSRASSRSSLSSIPASVLIHPVDKLTGMDLHENITGYRVEQSEASFGDVSEIPFTTRTIRQREAVFRKPSSVRAMQMHTEDEGDEDDYLTPPRRRVGNRSPALKRSPYYSPNAQKHPKQKKEAPLVLLHCTLLPPSIPVPGAADPRNQEILEDEVPAEYWKRWRRLQDRVGSEVLRHRGVLISHPEDLYDVLEERLLESLELQRPRLQNGHFVGREDEDISGDDFSDVEDETDGEQGDECPDCGSHVRHGDSNRKWEIRVFAANGLMRAGAWAAAWRDMEKVDVEVGLWLPSDVRRGLERRLAEEQMAAAERDQAQSPHMQMMHMSSLVDGKNQVFPEILQSPRQGHARMVSDVGSFQSDGAPTYSTVPGPHVEQHDQTPRNGEKRSHEVALSTLFANYIRVLAADRRNVALAFLTILVAFLAIGYGQQQPLFSDVSLQGITDTTRSSVVHSMGVVSSSAAVSQPTFRPMTADEEAVNPNLPIEAGVADAASFDEFDTPSDMTVDSEPTEVDLQVEVEENYQTEPASIPEGPTEPISEESQMVHEEPEGGSPSLEFTEAIEEPEEDSESFESTEAIDAELDQPEHSHSDAGETSELHTEAMTTESAEILLTQPEIPENEEMEDDQQGTEETL